MKSYGNLFDKIVCMENLHTALKQAAKGKKKRRQVSDFLENQKAELLSIQNDISNLSYCPGNYNQFKIMDPKPRLISCAPFRDRVVHHAVCNIISPLLEKQFISCSYACRKSMGMHKAVLKAQSYSLRYKYFFKTDISRFYDSIDHIVLKKMLLNKFRETELKKLLETIIEHPVPGQKNGRGLPIGNLTSQWFANYYLDKLDHYLKEQKQCNGYVRYMDDFVVWSNSKNSLFELWADIRLFLLDELKLNLKLSGSFVKPVTEGTHFLGMLVYPGCIRMQRKRLKRSRNLLKQQEAQYQQGNISIQELFASATAIIAAKRYFCMGSLFSENELLI